MGNGEAVDINLNESYYLIFLLMMLGLAPFAAIMVTSFIKLVVVLSLIRNALGVQSIPPNLVINGLAIILTFYIMAPVGEAMIHEIQKEKVEVSDFQSVKGGFERGQEPLRKFLMKHSDPRERKFFLKSAHRLWEKERAEKLREDDLIVLIPAFTVSELSAAFRIGFLIFLPFLAIDLIVSNILLSMGMMMVSPMTVSLPFKLLLFVLVDGWGRLIHGLVLTYA